MFKLTRTETRLVAAILLAFLIGLATKQYRARHKPVAAPAALTSKPRI